MSVMRVVLTAAGWLRLIAAAAIVWVLVSETPARLARMQLASLAPADVAGEVRFLREAGRFGEAIAVGEMGVEGAEGRDAELERELELARAEQASVWRRVKDAGMGAVSGRGESIEALIGAIAADMFIVGDVRDLVIEGTKEAIDGGGDEVVLALSAVGVATTLTPALDWTPALMKVARKTGAMSAELGEWIVRTARRGGGSDELVRFLTDVRVLSERASPGGAVRLMRHAAGPGDVAAMARFAERNRHGGAALLMLGDEGAAAVKGAAAVGKAGDEVVMAAARKGTAGAAWLRAGGWRVLMRPHPIVGVVKAVYKGNAEELVRQSLRRLDGSAWWLLPAAGAWLFVEVMLAVRRVMPRQRGGVEGSVRR